MALQKMKEMKWVTSMAPHMALRGKATCAVKGKFQCRERDRRKEKESKV